MTILTNKLSGFLSSTIPPETMMMFLDSCPSGWAMVTGVADKYLNVTDVDGNSGDVVTPSSTAHSHGVTWNDASGGESNYISGNTGNTTPTIVYPAIKYILCRKI